MYLLDLEVFQVVHLRFAEGSATAWNLNVNSGKYCTKECTEEQLGSKWKVFLTKPSSPTLD